MLKQSTSQIFVRSVAMSVGCVVLIIKNWLSGIPRKLMGDDLGWVLAVLSREHPLSNPITAVTVSVSGKWRPLAQSLMAVVVRLCGENPINYFLFCAVLLAILGWFSADLIKNLGTPVTSSSQLLVSGLLIVAVMSSGFADYATFSPFSAMELPPVVLFIAVLSKALKNRNQRIELDLKIVVAVWCSVLFHERYLVFVAGIWLWTVAHLIGRAELSVHISKACSLNAGVTLVYCYVKTQMIQVPLLAAGGESSIEVGTGSAGLVRRLSDATAASMGSEGFSSVYYWTDSKPIFLSGSVINQISVVIFTMAVVAVVALGATKPSFLRSWAKHLDTILPNLNSVTLMAFMGILPGITVVSRIEARWLYLSWILFLVVAIAFVSATTRVLAVPLALIALVSVANPSFTHVYRDVHQFQTDRMYDQIVESRDMRIEAEEDWSLLYLNRRISSQWDTQGQRFFERIQPRPTDIDLEKQTCEEGKCLLVINYPNDTDVFLLGR